MAPFLEDAIRSVLSQDYPKLEYIVMDGGSTDGTLEILRRYEGRLRWESRPDRGQSDAINRGFLESRGEIFAYLCADDAYLPGAVRSAVRHLLANPGYAGVYGEGYLVDEKGAILCRYPTHEFDPERLKTECFICQPTVFLRREAFAEAGMLDPDLHYALDYDLWVRLAKRHRLLKVHGYLAVSRMHRRAKTLGRRRMMYKKHMEIARRHYGYAPFSNVYGYCCALLDSRDGLYEPVPPSLPKYLLSWLVGSLGNWRHPLRFWKECLCAGLDAWKRGAWPPGGRPSAAPPSPGPVVATGWPGGYSGNELRLPGSAAAAEEAPTAGSASLPVREIWLDVGAHLGEKTLAVAQQNPLVRVYAFEPNLRIAAQRMGLLPNYIVLPMAVAEQDGSADFYLNRFTAASSLLPFNSEGLRGWIGGEALEVESQLRVPTIRLDTFLNNAGIARVHYLKVDAQGADLAVVRSAGARLRDIARISLEVQTTPVPLYEGSATKEEVVSYLEAAGFTLVAAESQSHGQEESLTFVRAEAGNDVVRGAPLFSPARACWNQRFLLAECRERILQLSYAVAKPSDLTLYQYAQLMAAVVDYAPDLILELGRGAGNSTCAFLEAVNRMTPGRSRILSICLSDDWERKTVPRLQGMVPPQWFEPLNAVHGDILAFDFPAALAGADRVLVFWDADGFDVAECVLGAILPEIALREHLVILHDLSDARYGSPEAAQYGDCGLWKGGATASRARLRIGYVDSAVEQAVAVLDFTSRNRLTLHSADESFARELGPDSDRANELRRLLGEELFSLQGHWFWFSLNEVAGPYTFPRFRKPAAVCR